LSQSGPISGIYCPAGSNSGCLGISPYTFPIRRLNCSGPFFHSRRSSLSSQFDRSASPVTCKARLCLRYLWKVSKTGVRTVTITSGNLFS